ncbi:hypothetical protein ACOMHN_046230 [Nucella lapillus]
MAKPYQCVLFGGGGGKWPSHTSVFSLVEVVEKGQTIPVFSLVEVVENGQAIPVFSLVEVVENGQAIPVCSLWWRWWKMSKPYQCVLFGGGGGKWPSHTSVFSLVEVVENGQAIPVFSLVEVVENGQAIPVCSLWWRWWKMAKPYQCVLFGGGGGKWPSHTSVFSLVEVVENDQAIPV